MNIKIQILDADGKLQKLKPIIEEVSKSAIDKVREKIPIDNVDIVIYEATNNTIEDIGFGASTWTKNLIMIPINSNFSGITDSLNKNLPGIITHELYHCLRNYTFEGKFTLIEALVNEGLADHFSIEVFNGSPNKWSNDLNISEIDRLMERVKKEGDDLEFNYNKWFFGSKEENIPPWAIYSIGFYLVDKYLKSHPNEKPSTIIDISVKGFLE